MNDGRLAGEVAIVTGGASGIGRGICDLFAREGAAVVIADLNEDHASTAADEISATGAIALGLACDVRDADDVKRVAARTVARFDRITILVNNAGYCRVIPFVEATEEVATDLWRVHVLGSFLFSQAALVPMLEQRYGRIVMIVSGDRGYGASPLTTMYQSAKSAQTSLALGIALAVSSKGVTVNCISPGIVETPLWDALEDDYRHAKGISAKEEIAQRLSAHPELRKVTPADVANAALFLCERHANKINGQVIEVH